MLPLVYVHCGPVVDFFIITKQTSLHPFDFVRNLFHLLYAYKCLKYFRSIAVNIHNLMSMNEGGAGAPLIHCDVKLKNLGL